MPILVVAEHDNKKLKKATLNTVAAAQKLGADNHVLVAGHQAGEAAKEASRVAGVKKVLHADAPSPVTRTVPHGDPMAAQARHFVEAIAGRADPRYAGAAVARAALAATLAARRAAMTGRMVVLDAATQEAKAG